jgi:hypothetical protein
MSKILKIDLPEFINPDLIKVIYNNYIEGLTIYEIVLKMEFGYGIDFTFELIDNIIDYCNFILL